MPFTGSTTTQSKVRTFEVGTQASQSITFSTSSLKLNEPAGITPGTYNFNLNIDGAGAADVDFLIPSTDKTWSDIVDIINKALTGATLTLSGSQFIFNSDSRGTSSSIAVLDGVANGFLAAVLAQKSLTSTVNTASSPGIDDVATAGYATITNTGALGTFGAAVVPAIASNDYALDITIDGGALRQLVIALLNTDTWAGIVTKVQTALQTATGSTETVALVNGVITVTSATTGITSSVLIAAGTGVAAGGDLLAAITALSADYTATLGTPVAGTNDIEFVIYPSASVDTPYAEPKFDLQVISSAGVVKTDGISTVWSPTTGTLAVGSGTTLLADGDNVRVEILK